ncbi:Tfp pilus assembly protein FimT [Listeria grayi]|uniref:Tfp pilus assembly protein FimT n=1 Tax=Listeria grayi TaxID=1641 RepID=A0A378M9W8_LISGR|nr:Tfp pilus assembly protein FimT [Listeria grayi]
MTKTAACRQPLNKNGFTLIETLLVLAVVSIIFICSFFPAADLLARLAEKELISEIRSTIIYTQLYALSSKEDATIIFDNKANCFSASSKQTTLNTIALSPHLKLTANNAVSMKFSGQNGNINKFGSIKLHGHNREYRFIFQIGKGRFRIEENNGFLLLESLFSLFLLTTFLTLFLSFSIHTVNKLSDQKQSTYLYQQLYEHSLLLPQKSFKSVELQITSEQIEKELVLCAATPTKKICTK